MLTDVTRLRLPLALLAVGAVAAWGLWWGRPPLAPSAPPDPLPSVDVLDVAPRSLRATVRSRGRLEPVREIEVVAEVAGRIRAVSPSLQPGRFLASGEFLLEIDDRDAAAALEAAEGALARADTEAHRAEAHLERLLALAHRGITSLAARDEARYAVEIARASRREAGAARARATHDLERCRVHAPFAVRVRERQVEVGQFVSPGTPLVRLYGTNQAEIRLPVLAADLPLLELAVDGGPAVTLIGDRAGRTLRWSGRIVGSEGEISASTRTLHLIARVDDPFGLARAAGSTGPPPLTIGQWVAAEIEGRVLHDVIALPQAALQGPAEVWVVDAMNRLRVRPVTVVRAEQGAVWVEEGLEAGERVVAHANSFLPGERVRPRSGPSEARVAGGPEVEP